MNIWEEVVKVAAANGLWAMLFVALLIYQLQDSRKRENKYQETILNLSKNLDIVEDIDSDVKEIKSIAIKCDKKKRNKEVMV